MATPRCPDCTVAMKKGWIPDATYGGIMQSHWHDGDPEKVSFLGIPAGMKGKATHMLPMQAWRCPDCGLVRTYAFPRPWKKAD